MDPSRGSLPSLMCSLRVAFHHEGLKARACTLYVVKQEKIRKTLIIFEVCLCILRVWRGVQIEGHRESQADSLELDMGLDLTNWEIMT